MDTIAMEKSGAMGANTEPNEVSTLPQGNSTTPDVIKDTGIFGRELPTG